MSGYAKSWTDKYNDGWYLSLSLAERGLWDQLTTYAKLHGDTGGIFLSNLTHAGAVFGCDRKTAGRILGKFRADSHIDMKTSETGVNIIILNYEYYQRVKKVGDDTTSGEYREKSPISRADKSKADKSNRKKKKPTVSKLPNIPYQEIIDDLNLVTNRVTDREKFNLTKSVQSNITQRWQELTGTDEERMEAFRWVHRVKAQDWPVGHRNNKHLNPGTLYRISKFPLYFKQRPKNVIPDKRQKDMEACQKFAKQN